MQGKSMSKNLVILLIVIVGLLFAAFNCDGQGVLGTPTPTQPTITNIPGAYQPSPWIYMAASGGGVWPSETDGATDGAAIEFTGAAATTLWASSFDLSDTTDESLEWSAWFTADYLNGGVLSNLELHWVTDDADLGYIEVEIQAKAIGHGDLMSIAYGTAIVGNFTSTGANKKNISAFSGSLTAANSPVRSDDLMFRILIDESASTINTTVYLDKITFRYPRAQ